MTLLSASAQLVELANDPVVAAMAAARIGDMGTAALTVLVGPLSEDQVLGRLLVNERIASPLSATRRSSSPFAFLSAENARSRASQ